MDPNETLRELRRKVSENVALRRPAYDLTEDFAALDEWLSGGGFLPEAWRAPIAANLLRGFLSEVTDAEPLGPPNPAGVELPDAAGEGRSERGPHRRGGGPHGREVGAVVSSVEIPAILCGPPKDCTCPAVAWTCCCEASQHGRRMIAGLPCDCGLCPTPPTCEITWCEHLAGHGPRNARCRCHGPLVDELGPGSPDCPDAVSR